MTAEAVQCWWQMHTAGSCKINQGSISSTLADGRALASTESSDLQHEGSEMKFDQRQRDTPENALGIVREAVPLRPSDVAAAEDAGNHALIWTICHGMIPDQHAVLKRNTLEIKNGSI